MADTQGPQNSLMPVCWSKDFPYLVYSYLTKILNTGPKSLMNLSLSKKIKVTSLCATILAYRGILWINPSSPK